MFHVTIAAIALAFLSQLRMPTEPDAFKWNVALVEPPQPKAVPKQSPQPTPPKPKATPVVEPAKPQPIVQAVQQRVIQTVQAVQQAIQRERVRTVQPATAVATINQTASVTTQAVHESQPAQVVAESATVATQTVQARGTSQTITQPAIATAPSSTREAVAQESPLVSTETAVLQQTAAPVTTETVLTHRTEEQPVQTAAVVRAAPAKTMPAAKADYGWLAASLWERIQKDMKNRYPYLARMNRLEGHVLLTVVVQADGSLSDIKVKISSGHAILDRDAEAFLASLSPLRLKYPLGKASQTIEVPISYSLRG